MEGERERDRKRQNGGKKIREIEIEIWKKRKGWKERELDKKKYEKKGTLKEKKKDRKYIQREMIGKYRLSRTCFSK